MPETERPPKKTIADVMAEETGLETRLADLWARIEHLEAINETLAGSLRYIASGDALDVREVARVALKAVQL